MKILVPCKLGEKFSEYKFIDWIEGRRAYRLYRECVFSGFDKFTDNGRECFLSVPTIYAEHNGKLSFISYDMLYDDKGGLKEFIPQYEIDIPDYMFLEGNLEAKGFQSKRIGHFGGLRLQDGKIMADMIVRPHYEHLHFEYPLEIEYKPLGNKLQMDIVFQFDFRGSVAVAYQ